MLARIKSLFVSNQAAVLSIENKVQDVKDVIDRVQALIAVITRSELILAIRNSSDMLIRKMNEKVLENHDRDVQDKGIHKYMSAQEVEWSFKNADMFLEQDFINISWRTEALGTLLWALNIVDRMPDYDTDFNQNEIVNLFNDHNKGIGMFKRTTLRNEFEILQQREAAELWHWRANSMLNYKKQPTMDESKYTHLNYLVSKTAFDEGILPAPIKNDFPAFRKAYRNLTEEEFVKAMSIAMDRHFALNWLCKYSSDWDETPTET